MARRINIDLPTFISIRNRNLNRNRDRLRNHLPQLNSFLNDRQLRQCHLNFPLPPTVHSLVPANHFQPRLLAVMVANHWPNQYRTPLPRPPPHLICHYLQDLQDVNTKITDTNLRGSDQTMIIRGCHPVRHARRNELWFLGLALDPGHHWHLPRLANHLGGIVDHPAHLLLSKDDAHHLH